MLFYLLILFYSIIKNLKVYLLSHFFLFMQQRAYNLLGNIAVVNFPKGISPREKKKFVKKILKENLQVKTVVEKVGKFSGRLRKMKTRFIAGEKTKEVLYKENGCVFRFNLDSTYFSPRLSNERREIASLIKKNEDVFVMFAGVSPFSIVIAKNSQCKKVYSNEINREANKYGELNIQLNKLKNKVELVPGDVKRIARNLRYLHSPSARELNYSESAFGQDSLLKNKRLMNKNSKDKFNDKVKLVNNNFKSARNLSVSKISNKENKGFLATSNFPNKFNVIVMPRPQLKETFLKEAFSLSKKGTRIFYYDFCPIEEKENVVEKIKSEAKKYKKKIKILRVKEAGEIAPYKVRLRVDFELI